MKAKERLFELERPLADNKKRGKTPRDKAATGLTEEQELEMAKLQAKIQRIDNDVLFDKPLAEHQWRARKIVLEKEYSESQRAASRAPQTNEKQATGATPAAKTAENGVDDDDINLEAERIAAEILAQNDDDEDQDLADLFSSLPTTEVDQQTGKSNTVLNGADGSRIVIRDFAKWAGINPTRVLQDACRAR